MRGEFFAHLFEPSVTLNKETVSVNAACLRKLPDYEYVQFLVNPGEKKLAIKPCIEDMKDSFRWSSGEGKKRKPKKITCKIFFAKIMSLMGWNPINRYKLLGKLIEANGVLLFSFDLNSPEIFQKKTKEDGTLQASRIPQYPEEWKNQFGLPYEEHRKSLQVDTFSGYVVFGIQDERKGQKKDEH